MSQPQSRKLDHIEKQEMLHQTFTLTFNPALPCSVTDCMNTATVGEAHYDAAENVWTLFPRCRECTLKMAQAYGIE